MPLYRLRCTKCGYTFDKLTSFSRLEEAVCEKCGEKVQRVYQGASVFGGKTSSGSCGCGGNCSCCSGCGGK